ncbi:MAG: exonuclease SbcCD subunit D [Oscillospiraceae bacterium]|nr:exonuclease SbcCD subunit D [Oscillospiraceae bacterium]
MRFIHLADLHIGKSVNGFSMLEEQRNAFRQILEYIRTERPAAVVIAGDVYDRASPGVEAVRLFDDFLTELAGENTAVLLISGNHDSPERLGYAGRLLADRRLYLCGSFDGALRDVALDDEFGRVHFRLLPFIKPSILRGKTVSGEASDESGREIESYGDALEAALAASDIDCAARNVLVSHQFYTRAGIEPVRSESEMNPVGGLDAVDAGLIEKFDYAALGHLHGAQSVGAEHIRYAGSPVKYSFSEWRQKKSVTLVELREKGNITITALPLVPLRDMREIRGELEELLGSDKFTDAGATARAGRDDYLRVILTDEDEIIDPMGKLRSVYPNVMALDFENSRTRADMLNILPDAGAAETLSPYELFGEFFLDTQGAAMSAEQAKIVRELLETEDEG